MNNNVVLQIPQTAESVLLIGASQFCDDVWDLSPLISQKSLSASRKKVKFTDVHSPQLKFTLKQYIFYKLGQVKPQSAIGVMHSLNYFVRYCKNEKIYSLQHITAEKLLSFAI